MAFRTSKRANPTLDAAKGLANQMRPKRSGPAPKSAESRAAAFQKRQAGRRAAPTKAAPNVTGPRNGRSIPESARSQKASLQKAAGINPQNRPKNTKTPKELTGMAAAPAKKAARKAAAPRPAGKRPAPAARLNYGNKNGKRMAKMSPSWR